MTVNWIRLYYICHYLEQLRTITKLLVCSINRIRAVSEPVSEDKFDMKTIRYQKYYIHRNIFPKKEDFFVNGLFFTGFSSWDTISNKYFFSKYIKNFKFSH